MWSTHNVSVNLQQDKCYSLVLQLFISMWMKSVISLKVKPGSQSLENGLSYIYISGLFFSVTVS